MAADKTALDTYWSAQVRASSPTIYQILLA